MDVESSSKNVKSMAPPSRKRRKTICLWTIAAILAVVIIFVILAVTVFKPKRPVITVDSTSVKDLKFSVDILRLQVHLNLSLAVSVSVKNPNKVGFKFTNSSAFLNYRGMIVGEAPIPAGKIGSDQTLPFNLTLTLLADRLLSTANLYSDVISGMLPLNTNTRVSGHVYIFNVFKIHVVSSSSCDWTINLMDRTAGDQNCHYKTKL